MRIPILDYYIKAIDCGSINRAARELFIAQSSLSEALSSFEKDLGCILIERSNKGITPTEIGSEVYNDAQKIIQITKRWESFSSVDSEYNGDYHILATYAMCSSC
jgi:LysR family nitrogen assimilation transcriptional regulator